MVDEDDLRIGRQTRNIEIHALGGAGDKLAAISGDTLDDFLQFFSAVGDAQSGMIRASKKTFKSRHIPNIFYFQLDLIGSHRR